MYMLDSTVIFVKEMGKEIPQLFATRPVINSASTVRLDLKTYADKFMFDVFVYFCRRDKVGSKDNADAMRAVTKFRKQIAALSQQFRDPKNGHWFILTPDQ